MKISQDKRGTFTNMEYMTETRVNIKYELPLSEIVYDFFDQLKTQTKGYASLDYEMIGYRESKLAKLDILVNGELVDALSCIVHRDKAYAHGRLLVEKLRGIIPRQMFEVPIQAEMCIRDRVHEMGIDDVNKVLTLDDLVSTDDVYFVATGVTKGDILNGVRFTDKYAITHTVVMRGVTGTVRFIEAYHDYDRKPDYIKLK